MNIYSSDIISHFSYHHFNIICLLLLLKDRPDKDTLFENKIADHKSSGNNNKNMA